jgi:trigger factor
MKVQVEEVSPVEKRLSIEVEAAVIETELSRAYAALSHQVKVPGFRPGKVPRRILEQKYRGDVEADVLRRVQATAFLDAVRSEKVAAVGEPQMSDGKILRNQPLAFTARVEVKPVVAAKDYRGLTLKRFDTAVTDAQVDEQLTRLRESRTTLVPVPDRDVAQLGDVATIDCDATIDGLPFPGMTGRDISVDVSEGEVYEGHQPQLAGTKVGEQARFDYTFPQAYRVELIRGETAKCVATVKALKVRAVPALDDAFAQSTGADSVEALRGRIRADLERAAKSRASVEEREHLFQRLIERNSFDIPQALVDRGIDLMLDAAFNNMTRSGMDPRMLNLDWQKLRSELRPRAETEVRGQLLLEAVCLQEKIEVGEADVDAQLAEMAEAVKMPLAVLKKQYASENARDALRNRLMEDRAIALVKSQAQFET